MKDLLTKYNVAVPRYTSYPPANYFSNDFGSADYLNAVKVSNEQQPDHISIYIHIPFCFQMCYYCGCNSEPMRDDATRKSYIEALKMEMEMVFAHIDPSRKVSQIHYGGGTPTSLPIDVLKELNELVLSRFGTIVMPEIAIECHPAYLDRDYWLGLTEAGFNRISIGIQDFDMDVLEGVNRKPSRLDIGEIIGLLRSKNVAVNMDFIYGLPLQTERSFAETIRRAIELRPDRIVSFGYAHVPWVNALQLKLEDRGLPSVVLKDGLYRQTCALLGEVGYKAVGLDHFVLPDDELYMAVNDGVLHRNFQGYCTRRSTGQVYAFGVTGISQLANAYSQNVKDVDTYMEFIGKGCLPVTKGYGLNVGEQVARDVISALMCNYKIDLLAMANDRGISAEMIKGFINFDSARLQVLADDGLIVFDDLRIAMQPQMRQFVRIVAAALDRLMLTNVRRFSKSV